MNELEVGQVLWLKIRFNNQNLVSMVRHPYLIVAVDHELSYVEIGQLDSLAGKEYKAAMRSNKTIYADDPEETVIDRDSYIQLDNTFRLELCPELLRYRRQPDKLSLHKLESVLTAYFGYRQKYEIDENKNVYMDRAEILELNP